MSLADGLVNQRADRDDWLTDIDKLIDWPAIASVLSLVFERDPQAGWTKRNGKSHFGYKAHIAVDRGCGIIRAASDPRRALVLAA